MTAYQLMLKLAEIVAAHGPDVVVKVVDDRCPEDINRVYFVGDDPNVKKPYINISA